MDKSLSQGQNWWSGIFSSNTANESTATENTTAAIKPLVFGILLFALALINTLIFVGVYLAPYKSIQQMAFNSSAFAPIDSLAADSTAINKYRLKAVNEIDKTSKKLATFAPNKPYIIINTTTNTFKLCKGDEVIRTGNCSTGSYVKLKGKANQEWIFKTPKGYHTVKGKTTDPVWKKPDWAFVEEGMPVPSANHSSRYEYGVLGDYALYMGEGYMIHGTLYQRLLGLPVTHGCIRLGDDDLEAVFKNLGVNSKVFII